MKNFHKIAALICSIVVLGFPAQTLADSVALLPYADGSYTFRCDCEIGGCPDPETSGSISSGLSVYDAYCWYYTPSLGDVTTQRLYEGIIEFDISSLQGAFQRGQMHADLIITSKNGIAVPLYLSSVLDQNEDGIIALNDINNTTYIGSTSGTFSAGAELTFNVTAALEHDLFDSGQTNFSSYVLSRHQLYSSDTCVCGVGISHFYDHTDPQYAPKLIVSNATTTTVPPTTTISTTTTTAPSTVVSLIDFNAVPGNSIVTLVWSTASEINNAGFNLYRAESENGEYTKINASLIPAQGFSTQGASYEFVDKNVQNRKTYYYKLEDIDLDGTSTFHGPVSATPRLIYGLGK